MSRPVDKNRNKNKIFVVSAASGTGKTSLLHKAAEQIPELRLSVSHTTRPPRIGEKDGVDYHFVDEAKFTQMLEAGMFLEHARVFCHRYGTSRDELERAQRDGKILVLEIDCQGARQVREKLGRQITTIFILPPSIEALRRRLKLRGKNSPESIITRLNEAENEIAQAHQFDIRIVNDDFDTALLELSGVLRP